MRYIVEAHYKEIDVIHVAAAAIFHLLSKPFLSSFSPVHLPYKDPLEREGRVKIAIALVELILEFHPVEAKCVQSALQHVHLQKYCHCHSHEWEPDNPSHECQVTDRVVRGRRLPRQLQAHLQEHQRQLRVRQREGPQPQVRGCVRDAAEHELDRLNHLMDESLASRAVVALGSILFLEDFVEFHKVAVSDLHRAELLLSFNERFSVNLL